MRDHAPTVNRLAPTTNVMTMLELVELLQNRPPFMPGFGVFSGPAGWGKSMAATVAANEHDAIVVQLTSTFTSKHLFMVIAREMGLPEKGTAAQLSERIAENLLVSGRTLILDEADHLVLKKMIEDVRGLTEISQCALILIGEELLPQRLQRWERIASRVLKFVQAQPVSRDDARHLARVYCEGIEIEEPLFDALLKASGASARRVATNLYNVGDAARRAGVTRIGLSEWGDAKFNDGQPPMARRNL